MEVTIINRKRQQSASCIVILVVNKGKHKFGGNFFLAGSISLRS